MAASENRSVAARVFYGLATVLMVLWLLYFGKPVLIPVALSILLAFTLTPLVEVLERWRLGRTASVLLASFVAFAIIGLSSWALFIQLHTLAGDLPNHTAEIKKKIATLQVREGSTLSRLSDMFKEVFPEEAAIEQNGAIPQRIVIKQGATTTIESASQIVLPIIEPLATAALVVVLVIFLMHRREDVNFRLISLMGDSALTGTTRLMRDTAERVSKYLLHLTVVNAAFGLWFGVGLFLFGVPYAPLWGFLTFCFRFIPFLGSPASLLFPLLISIATSTGWALPIWVLVFFGVSELVTANVIEPIVFGKTTGLTPIALLIAALFWAWIWGPVGLLLSTPLTVCLVVLGQHLPHLRSLKVLLAEQPVLEPGLQYFQRLLAKNGAEGQRVLQQYVSEFGLLRACDEMLLPALMWTRLEHERQSISSSEEQEILESARASALALNSLAPDTVALPNDEESSGTAAAQPIEPVCKVFGYPAHDASEEIVLQVMQQLIVPNTMAIASPKDLPSRVLANLKKDPPDIVVLCVIPPGGLAQVKYMCTEIRKRCPSTHILVAYFGRIKDYDGLLIKLRDSGASYMATSLAQSVQQIAAFAIDDVEERKLADTKQQLAT